MFLREPPVGDADWRAAYEGSPERDATFTTLSGEPVRPLYTQDDLPAGERIGLPGRYPFTRGPYPSMYRGRLWTMRQFAGFGTAEETNERFRYLLEHGQTGLSTAFDMPSLDGARLRLAALAGRGRTRGRRDRHARRHADAVRGHRPRGGQRLDDDQRPGRHHARLLRRRGRGAGGPGGPARRHDPGRHPQGVHRAEGVVLPDRPGDAPAGRHDRVVLDDDAALAPGVDQRLPHPRGRLDRRAGARVHAEERLHLRRAGARARTRRRRLRAAAELLLQRADRLLRGDREVPRRAAHLGPGAARHLRRDRTRARG